MGEHQPNTLEIRELEKSEFGVLYEFFVDGQSLAQTLGILDRPRCMEFRCFALDDIGAERTDNMRHIRNAVEAFLGKRAPANQFGSGRIVLYRCHCGCDYCGVISFRLSTAGESIRWSDICYENDTLDDAYSTEDLVFQKDAYARVFGEYLAAVPRTASTFGQ